MSVKVCCADGNFTTGATWAAADATSLQVAVSNATLLTTAYVESATFTPGAITIDAIAVRIQVRTTSPSGTMSVRLAQAGSTVVGTEVTVNVSDVPVCAANTSASTPEGVGEGGWFLLKFAAPVLLLAATLYTVSAKTSAANQVTLLRDGTANNWSRILRTTTTGAPGAGDDFLITGEWTAAATVTPRSVVMDSTATTDYGSGSTNTALGSAWICNNGTLTWGTTAATNYKFRLSGILIVYRGGTYNQGANGAEVPRDSTAEFQLDCVNAGDFGIIFKNGSIGNFYGLSRTVGKDITWTYLAADLAGAGTTGTTVADTGWKANDIICIAATNRPTTNSGTTQAESVTLSGDAVGTAIAFNAVANAHSGTAPTQAEVGLLTRNVKVTIVTATKCGFIFCGAGAVVNASWAEFSQLGVLSLNKDGIETEATTASGGDFILSHCSMHSGISRGVVLEGKGTVEYCVVYNCGNVAYDVRVNTQSWTIDNCLSMASGADCFVITDAGGNVTNCNGTSAKNSSGHGIHWGEASTLMGTYSGLIMHSNSAVGFLIDNGYGTFDDCTAYYNGNNGFIYNLSTLPSTQFITYSNCVAFGNTTNNYTIISTTINGQLVFDNCISNSTTGNATATGLAFATNLVVGGPQVTMYSCDFSTASGIKTAHTTDIAFGSTCLVRAIADNCIFGAATVLSGQTNFLNDSSYFGMQRLQQTDNNHRRYKKYGTMLSNTVTVQSGPMSQELQPNNAGNKLKSAPIYVPVNDGATATINIDVRKNGAYAGNAPRLILVRQDSLGVTADVVCDTLTVGADTWETLAYTTGAALDNGAFEFYVDCDGTTGSVFIDNIVVL